MWIGLVCLYGVLKGVRDIIKKKAMEKNSAMEVLFFYTFTHSNNWLSVGIFVAGASFFVFLAFWDLYRIVKGIWRWSEQRAVV